MAAIGEAGAGDDDKFTRLAHTLVRGAVTLLAIGMIAVIGGIIAGPLFLPGTWLLAIAFVALGAAGVIAIIRRSTLA